MYTTFHFHRENLTYTRESLYSTQLVYHNGPINNAPFSYFQSKPLSERGKKYKWLRVRKSVAGNNSLLLVD